MVAKMRKPTSQSSDDEPRQQRIEKFKKNVTISTKPNERPVSCAGPVTRSNPTMYDLRKTYVPLIPPPGQPLTYIPSRTVKALEQLEEAATQRKKRRKAEGASTMTQADKQSATQRASAQAVILQNAVQDDATDESNHQLPGGFIREEDVVESSPRRARNRDIVVEDVLSSDGLPHETDVERAHRHFYIAKEKLKSAIHQQRVRDYADDELEELEDITTSDDVYTDQLESESRHIIIGGDYKLEIEIKATLNKRMLLRQSMDGYSRRSFAISVIDELVSQRLDKAASSQTVEVEDIQIGYKPTKGTTAMRYTSMEALDTKSGEDLMIEIDRHRQESQSNSPYRVVFTIHYITTTNAAGSSPPRAPRVAPIMISSSPPANVEQDTFRTKQLKEKLGLKRDNYRVRGEQQQVLIERYTCIDKSCPNHPNFCWIEHSSRQHYAVDMSQLKQWASAIELGTASLENPPLNLALFWVQQQKPVGVSGGKEARPTVKSLQERQALLEEKQLEWHIRQQEDNMRRALEEGDERRQWQARQQETALRREQEEAEERRQRTEYRRREMDDRDRERQDRREERDQEREDRREERREERELQQEKRRQKRVQQALNYTQFTGKYTVILSLYALLTRIKAALPSTMPYSTLNSLDSIPQRPTSSHSVKQRQISPVKQPSSPIDASADETELVEAFFEWKLSTIQNEHARTKWLEVFKIVQEEMWSLEQMKEMSVSGGERRLYALQKGIPEGIVSSISSVIHQFKVVHRNQVTAD